VPPPPIKPVVVVAGGGVDPGIGSCVIRPNDILGAAALGEGGRRLKAEVGVVVLVLLPKVGAGVVVVVVVPL